MTTALLVVVCLYTVLLFLAFGALVEMYEQLRQVRRHLDMYDRPTPLDLGESHGLRPSEVGLPATLDQSAWTVLAFLSNRCETCMQIASELRASPLPESLWVVVVPVDGDATAFIDTHGLVGDRVLVDHDERITGRIGMEITPSALVIEDGKLARAQTVPTTRQLHAALASREVPPRTLVPREPISASVGNGDRGAS